MKRLLWWIIAGTRGGANRARIITILHDRPSNANQLAEMLNLDYKTIRHHLDVLTKNGIIVTQGDGYGMVYFLSVEVEEEYAIFQDIWERFGKTRKSKTRSEED
ncbi:MAG: winged helix-turn-helix transcriptional regulator [Candidatus Thorarchaeota archaeon]|nr:winged helix-turn-helix transcriptional regulator [Candidatus Thorarchaeota archaeon]